MSIPVTLWHQQPLPDGAMRIVAVSEDGKTLHVARMLSGQTAVAEVSFELSYAFDLASACLAGNATALTTPGLARMLCAAVVCLGKAALKANGIQTLEPNDDPDQRNRNDAD